MTAGLPGPPVLELLSVRAAYGRIPVLHGVDLAVPTGSVFALFGPNGAGKSTILKVAGGRLRPTAGEVRLEGKPLGRTSADALARRGVCTVPEGRGVFPNLAVHENLRMWTYRGDVGIAEAEQRAYDTFPVLKLRRRQLAGTLSGGEQQMLAVARALVGRPMLLLLDEVSMGLAPVVVDQLYEVVTALAAGGMTIVLVEQFVHTAQAVATRAAIVVQGRVYRVGEPAEIAALAAGAYLSGAAGTTNDTFREP
ncbi:MAG TPA: ABC transporter ATP-binding protein [Acidimicrobiales bacterium]|nr:ABC transporter ATP-binding protein [Acidimicrobiales bacterium]